MEYILSEYDKLLQGEREDVLTEDEKTIVGKMRVFIAKELEELQTGESSHPLSLGSSFVEEPMKEETDSGKNLSEEEAFSALYAIRSNVLSAQTLGTLKLLYEEFNDIDRGLRVKKLSRQQKEFLADTERMIKDIMRRYIIKVERQAEEEVRRDDELREKIKKDIIKGLLREKESVKESREKERIVFIESNSFERSVVESKLKEAGFQVTVYSHYDIPLSVFTDERMRIVLLDDDIINKKTGIDFISELFESNKIHEGKTLSLFLVHTNSSVFAIRNLLKRRGLTKKNGVFVTSKRDLPANIRLMREIIAKEERQEN